MHDVPDAARRSQSDNVIEVGFEVPIMALRHVSCDLDGHRLLSDVTLTVRTGRRTVIIGPNGAGKSLLLRLLHGMIHPSLGDVLWRGSPLGTVEKPAQAMVFQRPVLLRRSVLANLNFALKVCGVRGKTRDDRAQDALVLAGLQHMAHQPARTLSGGEQQRLAIARALCSRPQLLLLDEPCASLDPAATAHIEQLLMQAHANGVTTVLVTHDQGQARRLAQDVIFLQDGRVHEAGPADRVLATPQSEAARAWMAGRLHVPVAR